MKFNQKQFDLNSISDYSNTNFPLFNTFFDEASNGYSNYDTFNLSNFNEMSRTEGLTNNLTNEEKNDNEIKVKKNLTIFTITNTKKNHLGRKRKSDSSKAGHNKYSDDNLRRKVKHLVIKSAMDFINKKIYSLYRGNIGHNILKKEFLILNKKQKSNANVEDNKAFLNKSIGDILSDKISEKYTNFDKDHNKELVAILKNENDLNIKVYFNNFFNLTFLQCLEHYRGSKSFDELNGIICFDEVKKKINDEEDYIKILEKYVKNYEIILNKKKSRKKAF